jgi:hypothetical protein
MLLFTTGNHTWSILGVMLIALQFLVVFLRVLPYLRATFGAASAHYRGFMLFGFPTGLLVLDMLMFCEPFGLLSILPFPEWIRQFVPACTLALHPMILAIDALLVLACGPPGTFHTTGRITALSLHLHTDKATRIIAEVVIESLPQLLLQSYIYVVVVVHSEAGTASPSELAMLDFVSVIPISIMISTVAMLKLWVEVVSGARAAGLTIWAKAIQLWEVGAGLPLDALKKGTIVEWACPYLLEGPEIPPLLDALGRNSSLVHLDMSRSGLMWTGAGAKAAPLVRKMNESTAPLAGLQTLTISSTRGFHIPVGKLRKGADEALAALRAAPFFSPSGPRREEILFIGDLLRKALDAETATSSAEEISRERTVSILSAAKNGKLRREVWEVQLYQLIVDGSLRRAGLQSLINAQALRDVRWGSLPP